MFKRFFCSVLVLLLITSGGGAACAHSRLKKDLDELVDKALEKNLVVGLVLYVFLDGKPIYKRACGYADREKSRPMKKDAIFRYSSMSKAITTATALALEQDGVLNLDDPVTKYLPYFTPKTKEGKTPVITLRHLITHTSGIGYPFIESFDGPYHKANVMDGLSDNQISARENIMKLAAIPLLFEPGTNWHYSIGLDIVGQAIEAATGKPLQDSVTAKIGKPLKMKDLTFLVSHSQKKRLTKAYFSSNKGAQPMAKDQLVPFGGSGFVFSPGRALNPRAFQSGGSGLNGTAADYMRFIECLRKNEPPLRDFQMGAIRSGSFTVSFGKGWSFGYCGAVLQDPDLARTSQTVGSMAFGGAYGHSWCCDPVRKISILCMTNTSPYGLQGEFPDAIRDAVYNNLTEKGKEDEKLESKNNSGGNLNNIIHPGGFCHARTQGQTGQNNR